MIGPMVIYGPKNEEYDTDVGPIMFGDFYHSYYIPIEQGILDQPVKVPFSDNNLINGKGTFACNETTLPCTENAPLPSFNFTSGKTHRLRLINPSSFAVQKITIDGMKIRIIANDFVEVEPYETDVVTLAVGQRSDVLVYADGEPTDSVWLRGWKSPACSPSHGHDEVKAAIYYENADRSKQPISEPGPNAYNNYCGNDRLDITVPYYPLGFERNPPVTEILPIELKSNGTSNLWYMANLTFRVNYNEPVLRQAETGNLDFDYLENVHNYGNNSSIRFVVQNTGFQPHPMHLHGHNIQILAEGSCTDNNTVFPDGTPIPPGVIQGGDAVPNGRNPFGNVTGPPGANGPSAEAGGPPSGTPTSKRQTYDETGDDTSPKQDTCNDSHSADCVPASASNATMPNTNTTSSSTMQIYGTCWDGHITNPSNPQRRDVQMLLPGSYIVVQWKQDNPGVWPFHCHIAWHLSAGFVWTVLEDPQGIREKHSPIPSVVEETCGAWGEYVKGNQVQQVGDGL